MKTLFSAWRRRRGTLARRSAGIAVLRAAACAAATVGVAGVAAADPVPEPPLPSDYAKSQPQKAVADAINKHRPAWKRFDGTYPADHPFAGEKYDFYDYDYQPTTKSERFRNLRGLKPEQQQRALAQLSGEIYGQLPLARAQIENQTYRNLGYLLRPDGVFGGVGVAPVIAAPPVIGVGAGPVPIGGVAFDAATFGPAGPIGVPYGAPYGGGGMYGGGFAPGVASAGLNIGGPVGPGFGGPAYGGPGFGGQGIGGQGFGPTPDPAFGPGVAAGTPVPAGSYLTPDGRLVGPDGQPVRPGAPGGSVGGPVGGPIGPNGQPLGLNGTGSAPLGPNGQPIRPNGPNFGQQGGLGLNAPGAAGGLNGAGTPIPAGSTFGENGEVISPDGRVIGGGRPAGPAYAGPGGPGYGGPGFGGPGYGGPGFGGPGVGGPGLIGPGYGAPGPGYGGEFAGPAYGGAVYGGPPIGPGGGAIVPLVGPPVGGFGGGGFGGGAIVGPPVPVAPPVGGVLGGWVTGYYVNGDLDGLDHRAGFDYDIGGVNFGLTRQISPNLLVGGFVGFSHLDAHVNQFDLGRYDVDTFQFGGYFRKMLGNVYVIGAATAGIDDYSVHRNVDYSFIQRPATANFSGHTASVFGELGYTHAITCSCFVQPFISLQYTHVMRGGFTEEGRFDKDRFNDYFDPQGKGPYHPKGHPSAGNTPKQFATGGNEYGSNLTVSETRDDFLRTRVGARFFRRLRNCEGTFRVLPELRAYWAHEEYDPSSFTARMCDMKDCSFVVAGLEGVNDAAVLGGGLTFAHCCGLSLYGNTDFFIADRQTATAISAGTQFVW